MPALPDSAASAAASPAVSPQGGAARTACPNCGERLIQGDRFCEECGFDLSAPEPGPDSTPTPAAGTDLAALLDRMGSGHAAGRAGIKASDAEDTETAAGIPLGGVLDPEATGSFAPAPPAGTGGAGTGDDTLVLGVVSPLSDPREETSTAADGGAVCVACGVGGVDEDGYCEHCGHAQPRQRDHQEQELEGVAAVSDRGLRHHRNEDAFTVATASLPDGTPAVTAVVCDGVSTAYRPDDASAAASAAGSESLLAALERGANADDAMRGALLAAFDAVTALADEEDGPDTAPHRNAPACTCVSAVITGPSFTVGWVGDSRAYWIPDDRSLAPSRLTEDDSWAARMVLAGLMTEAEAYADERAHAITGWLGADAVEVDPHVASFQPDCPGVIVVCTDGLWNYAESASDMAGAVPADARSRPLHSARTLLGVALDGGGHDNVTVAVLPFPATVSRAGFPPA